jgi:hypothetical protein
MPSIEHLVEYIEDGWKGAYETNRTSSRHSDVHFTGFAFECSPRKSYPYRVARNRSRAELEIRQLLPRAAVYGRSHPGSLPILIRPPFIGRVVIRGKAHQRAAEGLKVTLFTSNVSFHSVVTNASAFATKSTSMTLQFAPVFMKDYTTLWHAGNSVFGPNGYRRKFDIRAFWRETLALKREARLSAEMAEYNRTSQELP